MEARALRVELRWGWPVVSSHGRGRHANRGCRRSSPPRSSPCPSHSSGGQPGGQADAPAGHQPAQPHPLLQRLGPVLCAGAGGGVPPRVRGGALRHPGGELLRAGCGCVWLCVAPAAGVASRLPAWRPAQHALPPSPSPPPNSEQVLDFGLNSPNSAVVMATAKLFLHYTAGFTAQHQQARPWWREGVLAR